MISKEYKKGVDLIVKEVWPIEHHEDDLHKAVSVFKALIEEGHDVGCDDIFQYLRQSGHDAQLASETQRINQVVKATVMTELGFPEKFLWERIFEDESPAS